MTNSTQIHFIRHGHVHNPQDIYYGRLPGFSLSEEGRRQAQATANALRDKALAAIFSSPLIRATETAEAILALHSSLTLQVSDLLKEVYSPFDGRSRDEMRARKWDVYTGTKPPYEQPVDVLARAQRFMAEVRQQHAGRQIVAVTHGDFISFATLWAKDMPVVPEQKQELYQEYLAPGSITTFTFSSTAQDETPGVEYIKP